MNKNDHRYIKTDRLIKQVFLKCIDSKGFDNTTISDICQSALISRSTFYQHFLDKNDLLDGIYADLTSNITDLQKEYLALQIGPNSAEHGINWYINVVNKNHKLLGTLLKAPTDNFLKLLHQFIFTNPLRSIISNFDELTFDLYVQLDLTYIFNAMISFTSLWLDHYDELTLENVQKELIKLCAEPIKIYTNKIINNPNAVFINDFSL